MRSYKLLVFLFLSLFAEFSYAGDLSLGVGYPYLSLKYDFKALAAEGRFVTGSEVQAYTGRGYWNFHHSDKLKGFTGLEGGYIRFNTLDTKGAGYEGALFVGGEYFITKKLSLMMDFAPAFISLKSGDLDASVVEYVVNFGLYFHFAESRPPHPAYSALEVRDDMAARRFFKAAAGIERLKALFPEEARSTQQLWKRVASEIEVILLRGKGSPRYDYALGFRRYYKSDWEAAVLHLKAALVSEPDNPEILKYLGEAEDKLKKRREQSDLEQKARIGTLFELANRTFEAGDYKRADKLVDEILRLGPYQPASSLKKKIGAATRSPSVRPPPLPAKEEERQAPSDEDVRRAEELYYQAIRDYAEGKLEKSVKNLRQGLILNPHSENLKNSLDRIEKEMKQK